VLALSWVIPVAGGLVLLPACLLMGLGAAVMSVRKGERGRVVEPPPVPVVPTVPAVVAAVSVGISNGL
jgi:hypothetical protein